VLAADEHEEHDAVGEIRPEDDDRDVGRERRLLRVDRDDRDGREGEQHPAERDQLLGTREGFEGRALVRAGDTGAAATDVHGSLVDGESNPYASSNGLASAGLRGSSSQSRTIVNFCKAARLPGRSQGFRRIALTLRRPIPIVDFYE
jgi:hypothetical protein